MILSKKSKNVYRKPLKRVFPIKKSEYLSETKEEDVKIATNKEVVYGKEDTHLVINEKIDELMIEEVQSKVQSKKKTKKKNNKE